MSRYLMELPSTDENICEYAIKWVKTNYPYINNGFTEVYKYVDFNEYGYNNIVWYGIDDYNNYNKGFLYWGRQPDVYDIIVPFPSYDAIDIGELL